MKALTIEEISASNDTPIEKHDIPEWGGYVYLRAMSVSDRLSFEEAYYDGDGKFKNIRDRTIMYFLIIRCVVDENSVPLFNDENIDILKSKNATVINAMFFKILDVNMMTPSSIDEAKKKQEKLQ